MAENERSNFNGSEENGFAPQEPATDAEPVSKNEAAEEKQASFEQSGNIYERYNDSFKNEPEEFYSPYANRGPSSSQEYVNVQAQNSAADLPKKKTKIKGLKAFIIAVVAVVLCVAVLAGVYMAIPQKENGNSAAKNSVQLKIDETPSVSDSLKETDPIKIADASKKFNVGILLYGKAQSFFSPSASNSLVGEGSGIIMGEDKSGKYTYILTCAHVISGVRTSGYTMSVQDYEGNIYDGIMVGYDEKTDIGVIKIEKTGLPAATFGNSSKLVVGQKVYAIGNPGGVEFFGSFTNGMISSIDRPINSESGYEMKCIQHTTPINSGNSGGALMNEYGQVIGINSSKIVSTGYEGMAFAIPISDAKPIIDNLIANGYVTDRPKLGITYSLAAGDTQYLMIVKINNLPAGTLIIKNISADSSLASSNAKIGDLILAVDGKNLDNPDMLLDKIENGSVGDTLKLTLGRVNDNYSVDQFTVNVKLVEDKGGSVEAKQETTTQNSFFGEGF